MIHRMAKVLIIEDDEVIAQGMARHLSAAGFDAVGVSNGETGLARLRYERPDVCVLDLMLPGLDGWKVIEQARGEGIGTPILVVSARGTEHDRIHALELGADDYLVKPFSMKELAARVGAAARRGTRAQDPRRGSASGAAAPRIATAPSTSSCASSARRSTSGPAATRSSRPATASATSSIPRRSSLLVWRGGRAVTTGSC
jgi:DNA-binding response OmpR family regulator